MPTMSQTLGRVLPMGGSSLRQSVIRFGDGTKFFSWSKDHKSDALWEIIDIRGYHNPFSSLREILWAFCSLKKGDWGGARIFNSL